MKKTPFLKLSTAFLSLLVSLSALSFPSLGATPSFSWYCVHAKNHLQPVADPPLASALSDSGFYADTAHSDPNAPDKVLYLTFDAGYENGNVSKILDVLAEEQIPAAFFILENLILRNPDLVVRMKNEGHLVCNHTAHHPDMTSLSKEAFSRELTDLEILYTEKIGGTLAPFYRPPEGRFTSENIAWAKELGYSTVFWSFGYPDWDNRKQPAPDSALNFITSNLHNGEVMLLHPTSATNAAVLSEVIRVCREQGYRFGTLEELCKGVNQ